MTAILTAAEMRALEQEAIARGEVTGLELMERAGRGGVEAILAEWPEIEQGARRAVVLCGPGNNGGDGFVVARLLKERGWEVEAFLYGDPDRLPPDARVNHDRWCRLGRLRPFSGTLRAKDPSRSDLIIDALFGTGLARPLDDDLVAGLTAPTPEADMRDGRSRPWMVAVDIPSGLDSDSGQPIGRCLRADLTVTFHSLKHGHVLSDGPSWCGRIAVKDIGLPAAAGSTRTLDAPPLDGAFGLAKRTGHKYSHGHALILSGRPGRGGAARMTARGALRIGAGLVTLAVPPGALQENAARLDAIMLRSVKDAEALTDLLSDPRFNALAAGPGLGTSDREAALLSALLDASRGAGEASFRPGAGRPALPADGSPPGSHPGAARPRALVLDADALTLLSKDEALRARLHGHCVLTPHEGEFARLFPAIAERWHEPPLRGPTYSKVDAARDAARESGATVLLKGPDTVIASPDGRAAINAAVYDRAAPWLATAGSGDVLAGFIAGLLARGFAPFDAACTAAWLHVECARSFGPGLIAEDLPEELPKVFRALGL
ncbi:NAD(P)HX epimerase / NAD(P)HX dehydratase [Rubellimicrobium mesophilum DSM 19309]|uniref:Bifunctional NAD(P)H-hydrate repair enzyme n=1 Tax=Rubellimicrobium mesophilum DSM 19309 TaxID=442562 RepID=A0A017HTN0_9RHOB|nr:NAD(P)H-hydrate epimerase [Rubellimicrobium mesophilum]EYD77074.1 NAD(P)HX epimerase / NAD(P)HX dehydratase [Rubellimicrobium mesophilum DSM 19309]